MRTRQEIEESFKNILIPSGNDFPKLEAELLLDIRELLLDINGRQKEKEVREARLQVEAERLSKI